MSGYLHPVYGHQIPSYSTERTPLLQRPQSNTPATDIALSILSEDPLNPLSPQRQIAELRQAEGDSLPHFTTLIEQDDINDNNIPADEINTVNTCTPLHVAGVAFITSMVLVVALLITGIVLDKVGGHDDAKENAFIASGALFVACCIIGAAIGE